MDQLQLLTTMVEDRDVKAAFMGHDHLNDFRWKLTGIQLRCAGGFGCHGYRKVRWPRSARLLFVQLERTEDGEWQGVKSIKTWKRLDAKHSPQLTPGSYGIEALRMNMPHKTE